jgi:hypothetical protein
MVVLGERKRSSFCCHQRRCLPLRFWRARSVLHCRVAVVDIAFSPRFDALTKTYALLLTFSPQAALLGLRLGLPTPHTPPLSPAGRLRQPAHLLPSVPGVLAATTPTLVLAVAAAGTAATVSVPSAQAVPATGGDLGLPGLQATGLQAPGLAGGEAAIVQAAPGRAGPVRALRRLGLHGADAQLAPPLLLSSLQLSPPARPQASRPAQATASASPPLPWTLLRLLREAALAVRVPVPGPPPWLAPLLRLSVFSALPSCFEVAMLE